MNKEVMGCTTRCKFCKELAEDCGCPRNQQDNRLLSEQEIQAVGIVAFPHQFDKLLKAQLAKTDKEWVE